MLSSCTAAICIVIALHLFTKWAIARKPTVSCRYKPVLDTLEDWFPHDLMWIAFSMHFLETRQPVSSCMLAEIEVNMQILLTIHVSTTRSEITKLAGTMYKPAWTIWRYCVILPENLYNKITKLASTMHAQDWTKTSFSPSYSVIVEVLKYKFPPFYCVILPVLRTSIRSL